MQIERIVNLERYPVDQIDNPEREALIARGREALERQALFTMPHFVRDEAIEPMARELDSLLPQAVRYERPRQAYAYREGKDGWPTGHPRSQAHLCAYHQVLNYQIPNNSPLRQIYYWQPLTDFLRELCGYETFFRSDCPTLALSAKIAGDGDTDGWHYDTNDVVFSLLLQLPVAGGEFEFSPYIRSPSDEHYDAVAALFADPAHLATRPPMSLGTLTVFKGDLSMHRVTPVEGPRRRIVALFCYDQAPGTTFDQEYIDELKLGLPR